MRVTNQMSMNRMLLNINRNARKVDFMYQQLSSGKKIQVPSDNPIIASRALKFRTNISDTEQYKRNAEQAKSWMSITEEGFNNMLSGLDRILESFVDGETDTKTLADRDKIVAEIRSIVDQMGAEMNISYAGRYVFSGYRTNHPPIVISDVVKAYSITQEFNTSSVYKTKAYAKNSAIDAPTIHDINKIDLPYNSVKNGLDGDTLTVTLSDATGLTITVRGVNDPLRYTKPVGRDQATFIPETGELLISDELAAEMAEDPSLTLEVDYNITELKEGDLNPVIYFDCIENPNDLDNRKVYTMDGHELKFIFGINTKVQINNLAKDVYNASLYAELVNFCDAISAASLSDEEAIRNKFATANPPLTGEELDRAVEDQIAEEAKKFAEYVQSAMSALHGKVDKHYSVALREFTTLGTRIKRVDMTVERLEQNVVSYTELMSENENVDYLEVIMNMTAMEAIYQASMMAGMRINQMTLADYIR